MSLSYFKGLSIRDNQSWIRDLAGAWVFYTIFPKWPKLEPRFERIARFAPVIGLLIGLILSLSWIFLTEVIWWAQEAASILCLSLGFLITGGLHLDGLIDTADGLFAGKEKCLLAMKDSRIGSGGAQTLLIIILIQIASLIQLNQYAPIALPWAMYFGRCAPLWGMHKFKYLHKTEELSFHQKHWQGRKEWIPAIITIIILLLSLPLLSINFVTQTNILIVTIIGIFISFYIPNLLGNHLGGHSGDSYGASVVIVETIILFLLAMIL